MVRKSNKKAGIIIGIIFLAVLVCFILSILSVIRDFAGGKGSSTGVFIEIKEGANLKQISKELEENGIVDNDLLFYLYAKEKAENFKFGGHVFADDMSYKEICEQLSLPGKLSTVKVVIPEGYELRLIAQACEDAGLVDAREFLEVAKKEKFEFDFLTHKDGVIYDLEGFLFPATYEFRYGVSAYEIIHTMLEAFDNTYTERYSARAKELGMTDYEVITLASVIEREAASMAEHKKVSGVFHNRIKDNMLLQSCATVQYILKERKPVLSVEDTKIDSPFNTYKYPGLPVGPVASPGKSSIEAALYPEEHDYYYFVAKADLSGHVFSKTLEEHNRAVAENQ